MAKKVARKKSKSIDQSTEEKIRDAASLVFTRKGYAATRTRDIAEESGINLALLNYYFRSKEKLFQLVMMEKMGKFFGVVAIVVNDTTLTLEEKVTRIVENYIELLSTHPDLPIFVLSEIRANPAQFVNQFPLGRIFESDFMKQIRKKRPDLHPTQLLMNLLGLVVFPFVMKPVLHLSGILSEKAFDAQMAIRREMIPKWINAFLKTI
jgi:AcrR family transcriptional regulator